MKALPHQLTITLSLIALISGLTSLSPAQDPSSSASSTDLTRGVYIASIDAEDYSLRRYAGQKLVNAEAGELGTIRDFIVHPPSSRVRYMVVSSGGVLGGMGNSLRLVPIEVVRRGTRGNQFEVTILQSGWLQYPPVSDDEYVADRFNISNAQHHEMARQFGFDDATERQATVPYGQPSTDAEFAGLVRASAIRGKSVRVADRKVAEIENIIVDIERGTAAAMLETDERFTGTTARYLVPLSRLVFNNLRENPIATTLTRIDFDRARPGNVKPPVVAGRVPARSADEPLLTPTGRTSPHVAAEQVSDALVASARAVRQAIDSDPMLIAENVHVSAERGKVVLRGTVRNETTKSNLEQVARRAAPTGDFENQIVVVHR